MIQFSLDVAQRSKFSKSWRSNPFADRSQKVLSLKNVMWKNVKKCWIMWSGRLISYSILAGMHAQERKVKSWKVAVHESWTSCEMTQWTSSQSLRGNLFFVSQQTVSDGHSPHHFSSYSLSQSDCVVFFLWWTKAWFRWQRDGERGGLCEGSIWHRPD